MTDSKNFQFKTEKEFNSFSAEQKNAYLNSMFKEMDRDPHTNIFMSLPAESRDFHSKLLDEIIRSKATKTQADQSIKLLTPGELRGLSPENRRSHIQDVLNASSDNWHPDNPKGSYYNMWEGVDEDTRKAYSEEFMKILHPDTQGYLNNFLPGYLKG